MSKYYLVKKKALPEILLKVLEAKKMLEANNKLTVAEIVDTLGISRSSFYKYKDDISPFYEDILGKTMTFVIELEDKYGLLSEVLKIVAKYEASVLTIHQSIPVNEIASLTISVKFLKDTQGMSEMIDEIEGTRGIISLKILSRSE